MIKNDDKHFALLCNALGDGISLAIVKSTMRESLPVVEISRRGKIPISSAYKKIKKLQHHRIVRIEKVDTDARSGKRIAYYRSMISSLELRLSDDGNTSIRVESQGSSPESSDGHIAKHDFTAFSEE